MNKSKKVTVIGGGASGLVAAIFAARNKNEVILLEKNDICGKKILATGNGRCNYWNEDQNISHFRSTNENIIPKIINKENQELILKFFEQIGVVAKIKNGYYYPFSNRASSMQNALINEAKKVGVKIKENQEVKKIKKSKNIFEIETDKIKITADEIILATGGKSAPKTGSTGFSYKICKDLKHSIIKPLPALVQLTSDEKYLKEWDGVRADGLLSLYENNKKIAIEQGEIQFTSYGISGICVFNLSGRIARGIDNFKKEKIEINYLYGLKIKTPSDFIIWMENRNKYVKNRNILELLDGVLNYKLINIILKKSKINKASKWNTLKNSEKESLAKNIIRFELEITGTKSFENAQVCTGGIPIDEINYLTMESKFQKNLYLTGELLDVDADCGGYNLEWAWITGMLAGKSI